jgi:hypothetical protein
MTTSGTLLSRRATEEEGEEEEKEEEESEFIRIQYYRQDTQFTENK